MKQYTIEAPDGRQVTVEGDREPTEADMQEIFSSIPNKTEESSQSILEQLSGDAPYLAGSALQAIPGPLGQAVGAAGTILEQPMTFGMAGFPGAKANEGAKLTNLISSLLGGPTRNFEATGITSAKSPVGQLAQLGIDIGGPLATAKIKGIPNLDAPQFNGKKRGPELPSSKELKSLISEQGNTQSFVNTLLRNSESGELDLINANHNMIKNKIQVAKLSDDETLTNLAQTATEKSREWFPSWASKLSDEYGAEYESALKGKETTLGDYFDAIKKTYREADVWMKEAKLSDSENHIETLMNNVGEKIQTYGRDMKVKLSDIDRTAKDILRAKSGKNYGPGEHILTHFRSNISEVMGDSADDLRVIAAKFAPRLQMKDQLFKVIKPFARGGDYDTKTGVNFFKGASLGMLDKKDPGKAKLLNDFLTQSGIPEQDINAVMEMGRRINGYDQQMIKVGEDTAQEIARVGQKYALERTRNMAKTNQAKENLGGLLGTVEDKEKSYSGLKGTLNQVKSVLGVQGGSVAAYELLKKAIGR